MKRSRRSTRSPSVRPKKKSKAGAHARPARRNTRAAGRARPAPRAPVRERPRLRQLSASEHEAVEALIAQVYLFAARDLSTRESPAAVADGGASSPYAEAHRAVVQALGRLRQKPQP